MERTRYGCCGPIREHCPGQTRQGSFILRQGALTQLAGNRASFPNSGSRLYFPISSPGRPPRGGVIKANDIMSRWGPTSLQVLWQRGLLAFFLAAMTWVCCSRSPQGLTLKAAGMVLSMIWAVNADSWQFTQLQLCFMAGISRACKSCYSWRDFTQVSYHRCDPCKEKRSSGERELEIPTCTWE